MATADELLSLMSTDSDDKTLVIDNYLRKIAIPKGITCLGVEYDDDVMQLDFKMPRYLGDIDLSKFSIRVNYLNAQGEGDVYTVKNPTVTSSSILFTWLVGPTATTYKGDTKFNVCLKLMNDAGYIEKEYNTTIATLPVLEGLETDERVVAEYTDILEQWKRELFGIGDTEEASIRNTSQKEQENIAQKGAEVLATIPEEYQETAEAAQEGIRTKADAIVCSAQGEVVTVSDSSNDHIRNLRVFGKTTQVTTTGKNLIDMSSHRGYNSGVVKTPYTGYNGIDYAFAPVAVELGKTYTFSYTFVGGDRIIIRLLDSADNPLSNVNIGWGSYLETYDGIYGPVGNGATFTIPADSAVSHVEIYLCQSNECGQGNTNEYRNVQLELGDTATSYEPYSGGFVSPSPDWPQPLNSVESPAINVYGKNLLKLVASNQTISGVTFTINDDQSVTIKGTATAAVYYGLNYDIRTLIPGEQYTITGGLAGSSGTTYRLYAQTIDGKKFYADYGNGVSFTATDEQWQVLFAVYKDTTVDFTIYPALRLKTVADETYEPYTDQSSIVLPYSLPAIPVSENGNYTDENGQQWICDEIDFERGVYIQRINEYVMTGSEHWAVSGIQSGMKEGFTRYDGTATAPESADTVSLWTHFSYKGTHVSDGYGAWVYGANGSRVGVRVVTQHDSVDALEEYLAALYEAGTPVKVQYILATPIETPLAAEELEAFKALKTNYPHTTVMNDAGAHMELSYNADTKSYVDNGIKQTVTDVLEAIENGSY